MQNPENRIRLKKVDAIIIDETSIVSSYLLDFINKIFCELYNCTVSFSEIMVLLVRDLVQLSLINTLYVFKSIS